MINYPEHIVDLQELLKTQIRVSKKEPDSPFPSPSPHQAKTAIARRSKRCSPNFLRL